MDLPAPPKDIALRNIIDKLAEFVARNGPEFEAITKVKQQGNPKFGFLYGGDSYQYYQWRVASEQTILKQQGSLSQAQNSQLPLPTSTQSGAHAATAPSAQHGNGEAAAAAATAAMQSAAIGAQLDALNAQQTQLRDQISQSEQNLAAQQGVLAQQQQAHVDEAIAAAQHESLVQLAIEHGLRLSEFDDVLQPIVDSCTKDGIQAGKNWILQHTTDSPKCNVILQYLLKKALLNGAPFTQKLHLIYLVNDVLHHCVRKRADDLKNQLENIVIPMFCSGQLQATDEQKAKLTKLLSLWESKANFFDACVISKLKSPASSMHEYRTNLVSTHAQLVATITQQTSGTFESYKQQHQAFIQHAGQQIVLLETQKQELAEQQKQAAALMASAAAAAAAAAANIAQQMQQQLPPSTTANKPNNPFAVTNSQAMNNGGGGGANMMQQRNLMQQPNMQQPPPMGGGPGGVAAQQHPNPFAGNSNMDMTNNYAPHPFQPNQQQSQQQHGNAGSFDQPPPAFHMPDMSKPPPGFANPPMLLGGGGSADVLAAAAAEQMAVAAAAEQQQMAAAAAAALALPAVVPQEVKPLAPFYELPAGLMVPLIRLEDYEYRPLDPEDLRLPPPLPPSDRLLSAVDAFYAPPSHERPRDGEGWEKLALYEYYKVKNSARKTKEEEIASGSRQRSRSPSPIVIETARPVKLNKRRYRSRSRSRSPSGRDRQAAVDGSASAADAPERKRSSVSPAGADAVGQKGSAVDRTPEQQQRDRSRSISPMPNAAVKRRIDREDSVSPPPASFFGGNYAKPASEGIEESNKGHQMLMRMGWAGSGTGLGTHGQGIEAPISGGEVRDRQDQFKGVGISLNDPYENFRKNKGAAFIHRMRARDTGPPTAGGVAAAATAASAGGAGANKAATKNGSPEP